MAKVAIITRTKNRNLMLARAMASVAGQSFKDYQWVVVNDGGDKAAVEYALADASVSIPNMTFVHHAESKGMEAASNAGIIASESKYIVIHDDDDTWDPTFLQRTVDHLESKSNSDTVGVITGTMRIDETIDNEVITEKYRSVWQPNVVGYPKGAVQMCDIAVENQFPPIAFLFSRHDYYAIGGYDESLPVLGDWDFNLRLIMRGEIDVIPELLANYHHRPAVKNSNYGNSVHDGVNKHVIYEPIVRNRIIRKASDNNNHTLATLVIVGRQRLTGNQFHKIRKVLGRVKHIVIKLGRIIGILRKQ